MKFELGQTIYFMYDNKIYSAPVFARMKVENVHEDWTSTEEQRKTFTPFGVTGEFFATCHGTILGCDAYVSAEELCAALVAPREDKP